VWLGEFEGYSPDVQASAQFPPNGSGEKMVSLVSLHFSGSEAGPIDSSARPLPGSWRGAEVAREGLDMASRHLAAALELSRDCRVGRYLFPATGFAG
jgi:hypothetical protein